MTNPEEDEVEIVPLDDSTRELLTRLPRTAGDAAVYFLLQDERTHRADDLDMIEALVLDRYPEATRSQDGIMTRWKVGVVVAEAMLRDGGFDYRLMRLKERPADPPRG